MVNKINNPVSPNELIKAVNAVIEDKQSTSDIVTSLSQDNTDAQYPSAKCMYDAIQTVNKTIEDSTRNLLQTFKVISGGQINLEDTYTVYYQPVEAATTFSFDVSNVDFLSNSVITFELAFYMPTPVAITFNNVLWQGGEVPEADEAGFYLFAFRSLDLGETWIGNKQGNWPLTVTLNPNFFAWSNRLLGTVYTESQTPEAGDDVYGAYGNLTNYTVVSYNLEENSIEVEGG